MLASGGEDGIEVFARERPDCVLLDVRMPGLDGPATCERIRAMPGGADVPIVFVTAQRDIETFDRALHSGGDDFMTKPFRPNELIARVEAALKLRRLSTERSELYVQVKQQRDDLQRLQLQKEQLVAFLVHDLKNPVNAIELLATSMLRDPGGSDRSRRAASKIRDEGKSLLRMITTLLDIAKADEGRLTPSRVAIELDAMVTEVFGQFEVQAQAVGVELVRDICVATLNADRDLLLRVLENLVENAIRHAPEGSTVGITSQARNGTVEIRVRDAGSGVPLEHRERVFDRFVQAGGETTRSNRGLGLAFCKVAVEAHGGRIWIEDAAPGAVFCIGLRHDD